MVSVPDSAQIICCELDVGHISRVICANDFSRGVDYYLFLMHIKDVHELCNYENEG